MKKDLKITSENLKLALSKAKNLLNITNKILEKENDIWIERLWKWADDNNIDNYHYAKDDPAFDENYYDYSEFVGRTLDSYSVLESRYIDYYYDTTSYYFETGVYGLSRNYKILEKTDILYLRDKNLIKLPEELFELRNLKTLDLGNNKLKKIPNGLSKLQNLETLILRHNDLEELPEELFELKNLKILDLGNNKLKRISKGLSKLQNLETLILRHNELEEFPHELVELKNIKVLFLRHNKFDFLTEIQYEFYNGIEIDYGMDIIPIDSDFRDDEYYIEDAKPFKIYKN